MSMLAMVDRVRWQLAAWTTTGDLTAGVVLVRLFADEVRQDDGEQLGLWGGRSDADERALRAITRLSGMVGEDGVLVPAWHGGRMPGDRYRWVPATATELTDVTRLRPPADEGPWPGSLPAPSPSIVLAEPSEVVLAADDGRVVEVSGRGELTAAPATLTFGGRAWRVAAWAGPWPLDERWWDPAASRRAARLQLVTDDGDAHLLVAEHRTWWRAATYA
jgi:protein ImuB